MIFHRESNVAFRLYGTLLIRILSTAVPSSLFPSGPGREMADNAWSTVGVRQWNKLTSQKKGKEERETGRTFWFKSPQSSIGRFLCFW